jgi:hypothetical protein
MKLSTALFALFVLSASVALAQDAPAQAPSAPSAQAAPAYTPHGPDDLARSTSEYNSIAYMKTVLTNERDYKKKFGHYSASLMALTGGGRSFTKRMARTDRGDYAVSYSGGKESFVLKLTPKQPDPTRRSFFMDANGTIRASETGPATAESDPLK